MGIREKMGIRMPEMFKSTARKETEGKARLDAYWKERAELDKKNWSEAPADLVADCERIEAAVSAGSINYPVMFSGESPRDVRGQIEYRQYDEARRLTPAVWGRQRTYEQFQAGELPSDLCEMRDAIHAHADTGWLTERNIESFDHYCQVDWDKARYCGAEYMETIVSRTRAEVMLEDEHLVEIVTDSPKTYTELDFPSVQRLRNRKAIENSQGKHYVEAALEHIDNAPLPLLELYEQFTHDRKQDKFTYYKELGDTALRIWLDGPFATFSSGNNVDYHILHGEYHTALWLMMSAYRYQKNFDAYRRGEIPPELVRINAQIDAAYPSLKLARESNLAEEYQEFKHWQKFSFTRATSMGRGLLDRLGSAEQGQLSLIKEGQTKESRAGRLSVAGLKGGEVSLDGDKDNE